jgi:hypothetical protein
VLFGRCFSNGVNGGNQDSCLARLNSDGSLDRTFDGDVPATPGNGKFSLPVGGNNDLPSAVAVQADGKIVFARGCVTGAVDDFCVARVHGGSQGYETCSMDIDGDGVVGVSDALLHARIALGFTGSALTDGVSFSLNATRNDFDAIRAYLLTQCGRLSG